MDHFGDFSELQPKNIPRTSRYFGTQLQTIKKPFSEFVSEIANKLFKNVPEKDTYVNYILSELQQLFDKFKKGDVEDTADILGFITVTPEMKQALETHSNNLNSITNDLLDKPVLQAKWTKLLARIGSLQFKLMIKNLRAIKKLPDAMFKNVQRMQTILSQQSDKIQEMAEAHANALRDAKQVHQKRIEEIDAEKQAAVPAERARLEQEKTALVAAHTAEQERLTAQYTDQKRALEEQLHQAQIANATAMTELETRTKEETTTFIMKMIDALNTQAGILESLYDKNIDETNAEYRTAKDVLRAPSVPASAFSQDGDQKENSVPAALTINPIDSRASSRGSVLSPPPTTSPAAATTTTATAAAAATTTTTTTAAATAAAAAAAAQGSLDLNAPTFVMRKAQEANYDGPYYLKTKNMSNQENQTLQPVYIPNKIRSIPQYIVNDLYNGDGTIITPNQYKNKNTLAINKKARNPIQRKYLKDDDKWEAKYLKYKQKYLELKNKLSN